MFSNINNIISYLKKLTVLEIVKKQFESTTQPLPYKSLVRPQMEYGNVVWAPYNMGDMKAIERVHRRATKMVPLIKKKN